MSDLVRAVESLQSLPGVAQAVEDVRESCTQLRWHPALRRRIPEAATESRVRGAKASADLEGAEVGIDTVRDLFRGAVDWPTEPGPVEQTLRAAVQATAESEHVQSLVLSAPAQALARLHVAAGAPLLPDDQVGRPRLDGEDCRELVELGPAPDAAEARRRLQGVIELVVEHDKAPALLIAAVVHAEIASARPFVRGNALVARAFERALLQAGGLDPTGVVVAEAGHARKSAVDYIGALTAYTSGGTTGVRLWLLESAEAIQAGARAGARICDAVLAGRVRDL
ncbi:Fic family protein [Leekyejoonella antrihumi]|uniref:Fido domain-containing protein n=1 Tax=Leekyejoonella antrihumi TaxID=1660198 RepID=A0A563DXA4_9MICO|nr:Fic family protein [Leekyejoonella antrihumi]TWP34314.1 hypothetical protein FGL98_17940 [Leekyejoonella antrihumi]